MSKFGVLLPTDLADAAEEGDSNSRTGESPCDFSSRKLENRSPRPEGEGGRYGEEEAPVNLLNTDCTPPPPRLAGEAVGGVLTVPTLRLDGLKCFLPPPSGLLSPEGDKTRSGMLRHDVTRIFQSAT